MTKSPFLPDAINAAVALVVGLGFALFLHSKWYSGGWMALFGDPPASNPAYDRFAPIFNAFPYVAAGVTAGLLAGFGSPQPARVLIRSTALVILFLLLASRNSSFALSSFVPAVIGAFVLSVGLSSLYFRLLTPPSRSQS